MIFFLFQTLVKDFEAEPASETVGTNAHVYGRDFLFLTILNLGRQRGAAN
jgi:hypothetical protein